MIDHIRKKLAVGIRRLVRGKTVRRLAREQDGIATVEFAIVAAPFLALMFAIMPSAVSP